MGIKLATLAIPLLKLIDALRAVPPNMASGKVNLRAKFFPTSENRLPMRLKPERAILFSTFANAESNILKRALVLEKVLFNFSTGLVTFLKELAIFFIGLEALSMTRIITLRSNCFPAIYFVPIHLFIWAQPSFQNIKSSIVISRISEG